VRRLFRLGWLRLQGEPWHPTDEEVLDTLDGEAKERDAGRVRAHLEACWACRARAQRVQEAITRFAEFAGQSLAGRIPPAPQEWATFRTKLRRVIEGDQPSGAPAGDAGHGVRRAVGVAVTLAGLTLAAPVALRFWTPTVSAAQLLERARAADARISARPGFVLRRVVRLVARRRPDGAPRPHGRVEVWHSVARGIKARRYYDENDRLVAGEWRRATGSRTVYRSGQSPEAEPRAGLTARDVWLWDATAEDFTRLVGDVSGARVSEDAAAYQVSYLPHGGPGAGLVEARLTIGKPDLHVAGQTLVIREPDGLVEYTLTEAGFEARPAERVAASVFEPDPVFIPAARPKIEPPAPRIASRRPAAVDPVALAALEIEAVSQLHRAGVDPPADATVTATAEGRVIAAVAAPDEVRKDLLAQALAPLAELPQVGLRLTVRPREAADFTVADPASGPDTAPAHALIKRHLERNVSGSADPGAIDRTARLYARWAVEQSAVRLRSAEALRHVADRWPLATLARLELETLAMWQSIVRDHVRAIERDSEVLRQQLEPMLATGEIAAERLEEVAPIQDVAAVPGAVHRLLDALEAQHGLVREAFEPAANPRELSGGERRALLRSLQQLEETTRSFRGPWWLGR
jgi:hypothetical protein